MKLKKIVMIAVVVLMLWYVTTAPGPAAEGVSGILSWLRRAAEAIVTFVRATLG